MHLHIRQNKGNKIESSFRNNFFSATGSISVKEPSSLVSALSTATISLEPFSNDMSFTNVEAIDQANEE